MNRAARGAGVAEEARPRPDRHVAHVHVDRAAAVVGPAAREVREPNGDVGTNGEDRAAEAAGHRPPLPEHHSVRVGIRSGAAVAELAVPRADIAVGADRAAARLVLAGLRLRHDAVDDAQPPQREVADGPERAVAARAVDRLGTRRAAEHDVAAGPHEEPRAGRRRRRAHDDAARYRHVRAGLRVEDGLEPVVVGSREVGPSRRARRRAAPAGQRAGRGDLVGVRGRVERRVVGGVGLAVPARVRRAGPAAPVHEAGVVDAAARDRREHEHETRGCPHGCSGVFQYGRAEYRDSIVFSMAARNAETPSSCAEKTKKV